MRSVMCDLIIAPGRYAFFIAPTITAIIVS